MAAFFGAVADDFTGATDLAALIARSGVRVSLHLGLPEGPPADPAPFEIVALKCRTAPVEEAVAEALAALRWLQAAGAQRFYWKYCSTFDSTPRGNIGPVAEAMMAALGADRTIYCPAFPENGRAIFMGHLFVGETPLAESPMKDHPLTPMRDSSLIRLLQPQVKGKVGLANRHAVAAGSEALAKRLDALRAEGVAHVVADAVADSDLAVIAAACADWPLLTGGSALGMALPKVWIEAGRIASPQSAGAKRNAPGPAVVLSGSCSAATNRQVSAYLAAGRPGFRLDPLEVAERGAGAALDWLRAQPREAAPLIYATAAPEAVRGAQERLGTERAGAVIEAALAACASAARDLGFRRFVVAGGETSGAAAKALGVRRVEIGPEIAPGVPWCFASVGGAEIAVALKSGNFGGDDFFADALRKLS